MFGLFKKKSFVDFGNILKVDIHSHLIPGIDDGVESIDESIGVLRKMYEKGYRKVITTPHIMSDAYKNTPDIIKQGEMYVKQELKNQQIDIDFEAAAEYYFDEALVAKAKEGKLLSFVDNYVLFELPTVAQPQGIFETIFDMQAAGYKPILAHAERYLYWLEEISAIEQLKQRDVLFQINLSAAFAEKKSPLNRILSYYIDNKMIDFLGTDIHHLEQFDRIEKASQNPLLEKIINECNLKNQSLL